MKYFISYRKFDCKGNFVADNQTEKKFRTIEDAQQHLANNGFDPFSGLKYNRVWFKGNFTASIED